MSGYEVDVTLVARSSVSASLLRDFPDRLMEALADLDESTPVLLDWSVGWNGEARECDIELTVAAGHHADAIAEAHRLVREALECAMGDVGSPSLIWEQPSAAVRLFA